MSLKDYLIKKPVLETERLILRELRPEDTDDLREWMSDPFKSGTAFHGRQSETNEKLPLGHREQERQ